MIMYPLLWLQDAAIKDVLVIAPVSHRAELSEAIWHPDASYPSFSSLSITLETIDDAESASFGTADILRKFSSSFQTDIIVLPCDFIPPPALTLDSFLNDYRAGTDQPIVKVLLYERGDTLKDGPTSMMYGIDKKTNTMVYVDEDHGSDQDLDLRMSLLWKYPNTHLTSRFLDSHVYIIKRMVLDLLAERPNLGSFKDDVLPWLCKLSYRDSHRTKWASALKLADDPQALALAHSTTPYPIHKSSDVVGAAISPNPVTRPWMSRADTILEQIVPTSRELPRLHCGVTLHRLKDGYAARANTIGAYVELNRQALHAAALAAPPPERGHQPPQGQPQISTDSIVSASTRVGERTSIKKSVLGPHCVIGKNVKISGCIIMDHVEVKDGAKLENTILSRSTIVEDRTQLKDCELAPGYATQPDVSLKGERLSLWQAYS